MVIKHKPQGAVTRGAVWGLLQAGAVHTLLGDFTQIRCTAAPAATEVQHLQTLVQLPSAASSSPCRYMGLRSHLVSSPGSGDPQPAPRVSPGPAASGNMSCVSPFTRISELAEAAIALSTIFHASSQAFFGAGFK